MPSAREPRVGARCGSRSEPSALFKARTVIDILERLVEDVAGLNSKLVLLVGPPGSGKSKLLGQLSTRRNAPVMRLGEALGRLLVPGYGYGGPGR